MRHSKVPHCSLASIASSISLFCGLIITILLCLSLEIDSSNVTNPLIYTKLRHDDDFLQIYRRYQLKNPYEEKKSTLRVNETTPGSNGGRDVDLVYYENGDIEASSVTQNDLILEAIDRTYKTRLIPAYVYSFDDPEDRRRASDERKVSPSKCQRNLDFLLTNMEKLQNSQDAKVAISPEIAALLDGNAKEETGLLLGNFHWTGLWRQCSKRRVFEIDRHNASNYYDFSNRYCVASLRSRDWDARINEKIVENEKVFFKYDNQKYDYARFFRIQVGVCLPDSCDSRTIDYKREEIRRLVINKLGQPFKSYDLVDLFCLPDPESELRQFDTSASLFISLVTCWLLLIAVATVYDYRSAGNCKRTDQKLSNWDTFVGCVSLSRNWQRLWDIKSTHPNWGSTSKAECGKGEESGMKIHLVSERNKMEPNDLIFLNFFKVLSMVGIIFGHCGMLLKHLDKFPLDYEGLNSAFLFHFNASTVFFVDWFFVMTGILTTYLAFLSNRIERNTLKDWAYNVFHRYWRLAPMYILTFWFSKSVFHHFGSGPNWDYGTSNMTVKGICNRESWIYPLTLTSNLHPIHEECVMPTWYISNDMQFYLITPFLLLLLAKSPIAGWISCLALIVGSMALRFHRYMTDPRVDHLELMRPRYDLYMRNNWDIHATYIYPQYRISSYLIGILAGHYAYMVLSGKWTSIIYYNPSPGYSQARGVDNKRTRNLLRFGAFAVGLQLVTSMTVATCFVSGLFPRWLEPQAKIFCSLTYTFSHSATSLGLALIVVALLLGEAPGFKRILSHPTWTIVSRLNYSVYLTQVVQIYLVLNSDEQTALTNANTHLRLWGLMVCVCYFNSCLLTLFLESPLAELERRFIAPFVVPKKPNRSLQNKGDNFRADANKEPENETGECEETNHSGPGPDSAKNCEPPVGQNQTVADSSALLNKSGKKKSKSSRGAEPTVEVRIE